MVHICWILEDVYDYFGFKFGIKGNPGLNFYPSAKYEDALMLLNEKEAKEHINNL
jgi:hypothetical protein